LRAIYNCPFGDWQKLFTRLWERPFAAVKLAKPWTSYLLRPSEVAIYKKPLEFWNIRWIELETSPSLTV